MANHWNNPGIPRKGWILIDVTDVRADGQPAYDTVYEECMMCGNEKIRYVHILEHPEMNETFRVGCQCAIKMTGDYVNPEKREQELRNRSKRRENWASKSWKSSLKGNYYLKLDGNIITIFKDIFSGKYKLCVKGILGKKKFDTISLAKQAAFDAIEYLKAKGQWP